MAYAKVVSARKLCAGPNPTEQRERVRVKTNKIIVPMNAPNEERKIQRNKVKNEKTNRRERSAKRKKPKAKRERGKKKRAHPGRRTCDRPWLWRPRALARRTAKQRARCTYKRNIPIKVFLETPSSRSGEDWRLSLYRSPIHLSVFVMSVFIVPRDETTGKRKKGLNPK